jgi:sporulation protein YabP
MQEVPPMAFEPKEAAPSHHLVLEERSSLSISGVEEVDSFDENTISLSTCQGSLIVRGENLHIEKLSLDGGDLRVEGTIDALTYEERPVRGGLFARLLR